MWDCINSDANKNDDFNNVGDALLLFLKWNV